MNAKGANPMISVVDYGASNIRSVVNMMRSIGVKAKVARTPEDVAKSDRIILPGVGHFDHGMTELESRGLRDALTERVVNGGIPTLGICLGAQLLARGSEEGQKPGLGWIDANVEAFDRSQMEPQLSVPHMGWAETWVSEGADRSGTFPKELAEAIPEDAHYYYVHSFHLACDKEDSVVLRAYHGYEFAAGVARDNILGFQFHPEKSHRFGKKLLTAFATWQP